RVNGLGDRWSCYCVLDEAGKVLLEQKLATTPEAMKQAVGLALIARDEGKSPEVPKWLERGYFRQSNRPNFPASIRMASRFCIFGNASYSSRRARTGSTRAARCAGITHAESATRSNAKAVAAYTRGATGLTPYSSVWSK